jgi:hypothetical protein
MVGISVCNGEIMDVSNCVFENINTAYSIGGVIRIYYNNYNDSFLS